MRPARPLPVVIAVIAAALTLAAPAAAQHAGAEVPAGPEGPAAAPAAPAAALRVADLAWLAGTWRGAMGGHPIDEHWSAAEGGEMVGVFRWRRSRPMYELQTLEDTPEGAVLRIRHFGPGLVAWEEKDGAVVFRPVEHGPCWALFAEEGDAAEQTRLRYRREADGGLLIQVLETRDGAESSLDFRFAPVAGTAAAPECEAAESAAANR